MFLCKPSSYKNVIIWQNRRLTPPCLSQLSFTIPRWSSTIFCHLFLLIFSRILRKWELFPPAFSYDSYDVVFCNRSVSNFRNKNNKWILMELMVKYTVYLTEFCNLHPTAELFMNAVFPIYWLKLKLWLWELMLKCPCLIRDLFRSSYCLSIYWFKIIQKCFL